MSEPATNILIQAAADSYSIIHPSQVLSGSSAHAYRITSST